MLHQVLDEVRSGDWVWAGRGSVALEVDVERGGGVSLRPLEDALVLAGG